MQKLPLTGLNIIVTRPHEQAGKLTQRIKQAGGQVILFPLLKICPAPDSPSLHAHVSRLHEFNLVIFISPNAVRYGMEAIIAAGGWSNAGASTGHDTALPASLRIATVGQSSVHALRDYGIQDVIAPQNRSDSEALLALPELQQIAGWRVAIFRGNGGREFLGNTLKERGARVEYVTCYQRARSHQNAAILLASNPDAITVTSSEALGYLQDMLDSMAKEHFLTVPLFVPHARIAETAHKLGWSNVIATNAGDDGLISGLIAWAEKNASDKIGSQP